jgi:hypothetical protein
MIQNYKLEYTLVRVKTQTPRARWLGQTGRSKASRAATELLGQHTLLQTVHIVSKLLAIAIP